MSSLLQVKMSELRILDRTLARDLELIVATGEVVCIVGDNGVGKSQLLKQIAVSDGHSGKVWFSGQDAAQSHLRQLASRRSFIEQKSQPVFSQSVEFMIDAVAEAFNVPLSRKNAIFEKLSLRPLMNSKSDQVSGGEWARIALSMALLQSSELLIADEIDAAMDANWRQVVFDLDELVSSVLLVTHDRNMALERADKVFELRPAGFQQLK